MFELHLKEFCDGLTYYTDFIKAGIVTEEAKKDLSEGVDTILQHLEKQRVKAIFDKDFVETQFHATMKTLIKGLKEENDK